MVELQLFQWDRIKLQKGETVLLTECLKRTSILDLVFVLAGSFLLYRPELNLSSLNLADVPAGCVYNKKKQPKKITFSFYFEPVLFVFNEMVWSWIILRLGHPSIFWEEWPFFKESVEKVENVQTHARLKQSYRLCRNTDCDQQGCREANWLWRPAEKRNCRWKITAFPELPW